MTARLLLSSVCKPFGPEHGDGFGVSYEGSHQLMWAQGVFRPRGTTTQWGIDFIAANLQTPTVTMHYPTMTEFIAEVKKGYDYVGIAFVSTTLHKLKPMVEAVRRHAPGTKIILGGYGTALGEKVAHLGDYICKGEGVAFMRKLLGERENTPFVQPDITQMGYLFSLPALGETGYVFAGLGCPNGCDFCATSHYFDRKHIHLLPDGRAILRAVEDMRVRHPGMNNFWINDEDFLLNERRGREFLEAIRASRMPPLGISVFSSVKALSQFTAAELVEMGIDWIWIGYEGKRSGYSKQQGRPYAELFADLHAHGISVMASMIVGFDYQTPAIIQEEFEELMSLRPTMCQFLIYGPAHGTPLYTRLRSEGRIDDGVMGDHSQHDGFSLGFRHPHIGRDEMIAIQRGLFHEEFRRLGPSVFRVVDDWLTGAVNLRAHPAERVRAKAERYRTDSHRAMPLLPASIRRVGPVAQARLEDLYQRLIRDTGPLTLRERAIASLIPAAIRWTEFRVRHNIGQQPAFTRREYRIKTAEEPILIAQQPNPA